MRPPPSPGGTPTSLSQAGSPVVSLTPKPIPWLLLLKGTLDPVPQLPPPRNPPLPFSLVRTPSLPPFIHIHSPQPLRLPG